MSNQLIAPWLQLPLEKAICLLEERMLSSPSVHELAYILYKCRTAKDQHYSIRFLNYLEKHDLATQTSIGNDLVSLLVEVGCINDAQHVFDRLENPNNISWNSLIAIYLENGMWNDALTLYRKVRQFGSLHLCGHTFVSLLKASAQRSPQVCLEMHIGAASAGILEGDIYVGNALIDMYAKHGLLAKAKQVLLKHPARDVVSWTSLILGYAEHGLSEEAIKCFEQMEIEGISPNDVTFISCLKACGSVEAVEKGQEMHTDIEIKGLLGTNEFIGSALVDMYAKCGFVSTAQQMFNKLPVRDVVSWTALISGYTQHGYGHEALECFEQMQLEGVFPNPITYACCLKSCGIVGNLGKGKEIYTDVERKGLLQTEIVNNSLVNMYVKLGLLDEARKVFDNIRTRNMISWTTMLAGYVEHGYGREALWCLKQMQIEGIFPNFITFLCSLEACGAVGALHKGQEIHLEIERQGLLESNLSVSNALIDMYAKCGCLGKAQDVFDNIPKPNIVSWNTLITGYVEHGQSNEVLKCFDRMCNQLICPDYISFIYSLKACGSKGLIMKGRQIHSEIKKRGILDQESAVGSALVEMYSRCGFLGEAHEVLIMHTLQNVASWNVLMAGYIDHGYGEQALECFEQMQLEGLYPNSVSYICSLRACGYLQTTAKGQEFHSEIETKGLVQGSRIIGNTLVNMYAKCGLRERSKELFDSMYDRNAISWNGLIAGYVEHGDGKDALQAFEQMKIEGILPNAVTLSSCMKACSMLKAFVKAREMHAQVKGLGLLENNIIVGNSLIYMYSKCGLLSSAVHVFEELNTPDSTSCAALIGGHVEHGFAHEAVQCFQQMQFRDLSGLFFYGIKACGSSGNVEQGQEMHAEIERQGYLEDSPLLGNALIEMYAKCGYLVNAEDMFETHPLRNVISWNAIITGCVQQGYFGYAIEYFKQMQVEGISPDAVTLLSCLRACGCAGDISGGEYIHSEIVKQGLLENNFIASALMNMYAKCGWLVKAQEVFDLIQSPNAVFWSVLLGAYAELGCQGGALKLLEQIHIDDISQDDVFLVCSLRACSRIGAIEQGAEIHGVIERRGLLGTSLVGNSLVNMYAKCGYLQRAKEVFDTLPARNFVCWTALMTGYAQVGQIYNVFSLFEKMLSEGVRPDQVTFVVLLNACSQLLLFDKMQTYYEAMCKDFGVAPILHHYSCMIDLLARSGNFCEAVSIVNKMPLQPNLVVWNSILRACASYMNLEVGDYAFNHSYAFR